MRISENYTIIKKNENINFNLKAPIKLINTCVYFDSELDEYYVYNKLYLEDKNVLESEISYEIVYDDGTTEIMNRKYKLEPLYCSQFISRNSNSLATGEKIVDEIRISEMNIVYKNGKKARHYSFSDDECIHVNEYEKLKFKSDELFSDFLKFDNEFNLSAEYEDNYKPIITDNYWRCICGDINDMGNTKCQFCNRELNNILALNDEHFIEEFVKKQKEIKQNIYDENEKNKVVNEKKDKNKIKIIKVSVIVVILIIILGVLINIRNNEEAYRTYKSTHHTTNSSYDTFAGKYDAILRSSDGGNVLITASKESMDRFMKALINNDEGTVEELYSTSQVSHIPSGTHCNIVQYKGTTYQVKLLEGLYEGNIVWVIMEEVHRK